MKHNDYRIFFHIFNELVKLSFNKVETPPYYFWRDKLGHEIDIISEQVKRLIPIEVKAGKTFSYDFFKNIRYWNELSGNLAENSYVVFGGDNDIDTSDGKAISWKNLTVLLNKL